MMTIRFFAALILLHLSSFLQAQNVTIPNNNFKNLLLADIAINTNQDSEIQTTEAQAFSGAINVSSGNISDLTGIEAFTALTSLNCSSNQLTSLDINANVALTALICNGNQLANLDISNNALLNQLNCGNNQLTALSTVNNTSLSEIICNSNQLVSLDISSNTTLVKLICSGNQLNDLITTSNSNLDSINCSFNQISDLDLSNNTALRSLQAQNNNISNINLGTISSLLSLYCYNNDLASLDLSNMTSLTWLECNGNNLLELDVSNCSALIALWCYSNTLEFLNVQNGNNVNFTDFDAQSNPLLTCIMVDSVPYSNANWGLIDPASVFNTFCTALDVQTVTTSELIIYPNPAQDNLSIQTSPNTAIQAYQILNLSGQVIHTSKLHTSSISIETLPKGIYFLQLIADQRSFIHKFVKQ